MGHWEKTLAKVMDGHSNANVSFDDLVVMLQRLGFVMRVRGSHHLFRKKGFDGINLQPAGKQAKPYQVRQVREVLEEGGL